MKTIIIAAGRSSRMFPLPNKNLIRVMGKPLIIHLLQNLQKANLNDFIIVANEENREKMRRILTEFNISAEIAIQPNLDDGMAGGVLAGLNFVQRGEEVFIHNAQDFVDYSIYSELMKISRDFEGAILAKEVKSYFPGGYLEVDKENKIISVIEKPGAGNEPSNLVNIVAHFFKNSRDLREALLAAQSSQDNVYEVALQELFSSKKFKAINYNGFWHAVKFPHHILDITEYFLSQNIQNKISPSAQISPTSLLDGTGIIIEDGVKIFGNACIVGPCFIGKNSIVGNNSLVRQSIIGQNCEIGFSSEIARSFLADRVAAHNAYVGDSVVDSDVNFGAFAVTTNLRLDKKNIKIKVKERLIETGRAKLGAIVGAGAQIGSGAKILPGRILPGSTSIGPNEIYK